MAAVSVNGVNVKIGSYGEYASDNYGAHALMVDVGNLRLYFSYQTVIAFDHPSTGLVVRKNDWSTTTGKHLNWVDNGNRAKRLCGEEFEAKLAAVLPQ